MSGYHHLKKNSGLQICIYFGKEYQLLGYQIKKYSFFVLNRKTLANIMNKKIFYWPSKTNKKNPKRLYIQKE